MVLVAMREVLEKYRELTGELAKLKDPARKERRQFAVFIASVLYERILCMSLGYEAFSCFPFAPRVWTPSHSYLPRTGMRGAQTANIFLDGLYIMADELEQEIVALRLSTKTAYPGRGRTSMKQEVLRRLRPYSLRKPGLGAADVFLLLDPDIDPRLLDSSLDFADIPFFEDLIHLILDNEGKRISEAVVNEFYNKHPRVVEARLKVKLYYNRGDLRAYVSDTCLPRAVSGAIVDALLRPKKLRFRKQMRVCKHGPWPAQEGNRLERCVSCPLGVRVVFILGDISSFTGSCSSSWALLLAATQALERNPKLSHLLQPIVFTIDNTTFECSANIAFRVYLYYATMMPVFDTTTDEVFVSAGGMLGVNGNISLTLLAFSIVLMDLETTLDVTLAIDLKSQIGGDDFFMSVIGNDIDEALALIRTTIENEVGHLKEFYVHEVTDLDQDVVLDAKFCKRRVLVSPKSTATTFIVNVTSLPAVPILADLLAPKKFKDAGQANKAFSTFVFSIYDSLKEFDCRSELMDILTGAYMELQPPPNFVVSTVKRYAPSCDGSYDGYGNFSSTALEAACRLVPPVLASSGFNYRVTRGQQLRYLLIRKKAIIRKLLVAGGASRPPTMVVLTRELRGCCVVGIPGMIPPSPSRSGSIELVAVVKLARAAIKAWRPVGV